MSDKTPDPVKGFGKFKYKVELFIWLIGIVTLVGKLYRLLLPQNINISLTALSPVFA